MQSSQRQDPGGPPDRNLGTNPTSPQISGAARGAAPTPIICSEAGYRAQAIVWSSHLAQHFAESEISQLAGLLAELGPRQLALTLEQAYELRRQHPACNFDWLLQECWLSD